MVLQNNRSETLALSTNGSFVFTELVASGANYAVTVKAFPVGQTCSVTNGIGVVTGAVTGVQVTCVNAALSLFVGNPFDRGNVDGSVAFASFQRPTGIAVDSGGNLFVADRNNNTIRKITRTGVVSTFAGSGAEGADDGVGILASFYLPTGITIDTNGNLYVTDSGNNAVRKITPAGVVTTLAGGTSGSSDGMGAAASFGSPRGIAIDSNGDLYVADTWNFSIRKITPAGMVSTLTLSGNETPSGKYYPSGIAVDSTGNLYVSDSYNDSIRKITPQGIVSTLAGSKNGSGSPSSEGQFAGIVLDSANNIYASYAYGHVIRKISPMGSVTDMAGGVDGLLDGTGANARFSSPAGMATDNAGNLFVVDWNNHNVRKVTSAGRVTTVAGNDGVLNDGGDGTGTAAGFYQPDGICADGTGNLYVADTANNKIRKISPEGVVTTLAGTGNGALTDGAPSVASFNYPNGITIDANGNLYVTDLFGAAVRKVTTSGVVSTLAGGGQAGDWDGTGQFASFSYPRGIVADANANLYVADSGNHSIRKVTPGGVVTTFVGGGTSGLTDATGIAAKFKTPTGIAIDANGNLYVADTFNHAIRKVTPAGVVTTLAGNGASGFADGTGNAVRFNRPKGMSIDANGNLYVADSYNNRIRKITPTGVVTTVLGQGQKFGFMPGDAPGVLHEPISVAVVGTKLYVTQVNGVVRALSIL